MSEHGSVDVSDGRRGGSDDPSTAGSVAAPAGAQRDPGAPAGAPRDPGAEGADALRARIHADLARARARTSELTEITDAELVGQHSPLMSPLVWDLTHIGNQEEYWLLRELAGREPMLPAAVDELYDAFRHPRGQRPTLPLLEPAPSRRYVREVRDRVEDLLAASSLDGAEPLTDRGFAFGMIAQHEQQHVETMLATHQLREGDPLLAEQARSEPPVDVGPAPPAEVRVPGGEFEMGTSIEPWALDNERPAHRVHVGSFWIDTTPVTNAEFADFIDDGGYHDPRWWAPKGWAHVREHGLCAPSSWRREGGVWLRRRFGRQEPVPDREPVQHVCWYEADAYARWAGRRLPTEAEWEKAARHDPAVGRSRRYPWGDADPEPSRANLGGARMRPAPAGSYPAGASALGIRQLLGDVWEWTSSDFAPYPGFTAFPYREYSEVFFGPTYKVLRGGSWAVDPVACRATFRNWDYPIRRQIFAGFRCARDAEQERHCSGRGSGGRDPRGS